MSKTVIQTVINNLISGAELPSSMKYGGGGDIYDWKNYAEKMYSVIYCSVNTLNTLIQSNSSDLEHLQGIIKEKNEEIKFLRDLINKESV